MNTGGFIGLFLHICSSKQYFLELGLLFVSYWTKRVLDSKPVHFIKLPESLCLSYADYPFNRAATEQQVTPFMQQIMSG